MLDKIQYYRQPIVTVTGILLGFLLNFAINWVSHPSSIYNLKDDVSLLGLISSISLLSIVLYRVLNIAYPKEHAEQYYQKTLRLFITGLCCIFLPIIIIMIKSFF